ncbi:hypothetical protein CCACVL1_30680 [Corchorus capsularis]|uniref:mannosyl-glycoprotein endo-beta-N-acetylglucosaminidase n=1 Tax=Corchorus capsularis TaxID=210143 RepID=A0A1R3FW82_COCAP|nr:hypothetical protein CCACVL1_30680 [Corchorus capsularis]
MSTSGDQPDDQKSDPTPPFDPSKPSVPISYPIKTLEDLDSGSYFTSFHYPFNVSSVPLQPNSGLAQRPRILVCHDMQGGYVDDKWVQGGDNPGAYAIWHWYLIDVFVYFSHNLVTLPPPCWTNTAHRHGVKVLGTFITEWDEGRAICNKLLATKESAHKYAEILAKLAVALGFDGWLLNMEVKLDVGQIPNLKEFASHLTQTMHSLLPGSLVIWYDSVTIDGDLDWQNQLNDKNKPFFDICDGIFANYSWKEDYPKLSAKLAGDRKFDVYMGIDVFGRNTYGGGQWTTNVALDVIKKDDVSAAIFAPGWLYETNQPPDFQTAQNRWWSLVEKSWGIVQNYPKVLPFYSNFDQGHGYHISIDGAEASSSTWNNISSQTFQPFLEYADESTSNTIEVHVDFKEASFSGGGNLTFKGTLEAKASFSTRLFLAELHMGNLPVHFTYSVKSEGNSQLGLSLEFSSETQGVKKLLLAPHEVKQFSSKFDEVIVPHQLRKPNMAPGWVIQESSIAMNGYTLTAIHAVCYRQQPERSVLTSQQSSTTEGSADYFAVLGDIRISNSSQNTVFPPSSSWILEGQDIEWGGSQNSKTLSVKISWKFKDGKNPLFPRYNIYVEKLPKQPVRPLGRKLQGGREYIGAAQVEAFYISELAIPSDTSSLKFTIQACGADGDSQNLDEAPFFQLNVEGSQDSPQDFLNAHNAARKEVGVPPMVWDNVLEAYALNYSQVRVDTCRLVHAVGPSGQNLAWTISNLSAIETVGLWVSEKSFYNLTSGVCANDSVCYHYTQVIWINSTQLGCARVGCNDNNGFFTACYYYPPGNVPGKRPTDGIESLVKAVAPSPQPPQVNQLSPVSPPRAAVLLFPPKEGKNRKGLVVGLVIGSSALLIFGLGFMAWFILRRKRKREKEKDDNVFDMLFSDEFGNGMGPRRFSFNELAKVTGNFDDENYKLGEGGFGSVYKGYLKDLDSYIAVKRVSRKSKQGLKEYASEVKIISRLRHKNLVKLIGWCHERGELMLIYEFMVNGSLDFHLFKGKSLLTWEIRYKIVKDLASALLYLHEEGDYCVLHRDIKTSNIMLDSNFNAKLGDFGLARLVDHSKGLKNTLLAGTVGYMAPECLSSGKASKESDVYSFGVVALEIACGRRSIIAPKFEEAESDQALLLVPWVWESYGNQRILDVADKKLGMDFEPKQFECLVIVGLWCAHPSHDLRPSIRQVIQALHFEAPLPNLPSSMPLPNYNVVPIITPEIGSSQPIISDMTLTLPR